MALEGGSLIWPPPRVREQVVAAGLPAVNIAYVNAEAEPPEAAWPALQRAFAVFLLGAHLPDNGDAAAATSAAISAPRNHAHEDVSPRLPFSARPVVKKEVNIDSANAGARRPAVLPMMMWALNFWAC